MFDLYTPGSFMPGDGGVLSGVTPMSTPIYSRSAGVRSFKDFTDKKVDKAELKRAMDTGDVTNILAQIGMSQLEYQRAITSATSGLPIRENLEAVAKILIPLDTPLRNRIARTVGSGKASQWRQVLSLGGGYAGASTSTASVTTSVATITAASAAGIVVGDTIAVDVGALQEIRIVSAVNTGTGQITVSGGNWAQAHASGVAIVKYGINPGSEATGVLQAFFSETGAPAEHTSVYANQTANYALMGTLGRVSGFAMAAGANFQNQLATEKTNAVLNLMLNEENALINGDASSPLAPWGDGSNPLAYNGLLNLITTANGAPADQVQTAVGGLTTSHIDAQLGRLYKRGAQSPWILANEQEIRSLAHLAEASGSTIRVIQQPGSVQLGMAVLSYTHPITGQPVPIMPSRFLSPGILIFGCDKLPDGSPALDVQVLPQVQLPQLAPNANIQGYVAQEIAPTAAAPQMYPFLVSCFSVLRMKSSLHFAISRGVTAV